MRVSFLSATFVAFAIGLGAASMVPALALGQANQGTTGGSSTKSGTSVAVVDIKFIFDNHQRFKAAMDEIKKDYEAFEASVREKETDLRKKLEELKSTPPGSEQFKQLEEHVAMTRSQVQLDIGRKQKQRVESEALVYHNAYKQIEQKIREFADRYGIDLVLQFTTTEIDPSKPDTVIRGLNRQVVFQRNLNITQYILDELNRAPVAPTGVSNNGATTQPIRQQPIPNVAPQMSRPPTAPGKSLR